VTDRQTDRQTDRSLQQNAAVFRTTKCVLQWLKHINTAYRSAAVGSVGAGRRWTGLGNSGTVDGVDCANTWHIAIGQNQSANV